MKKDINKVDVLQFILDYFMTSPADELAKMPLKEFKIMIHTLPLTTLYQTMCISLMDDFIVFEDYEKCAILRDYISKNNVNG